MLFFATMGAYAVNAQALDLVILLVLGLLGFAMRRYGLPVLPLVIGVILGPEAEKQMRRTLQLTNGDVAGLWSEQVAVTVYLAVALILLWPFIATLVRHLRGTPAPMPDADTVARTGETTLTLTLTRAETTTEDRS